VSLRARDEGAVPFTVGPGPSSGAMGTVAGDILRAFDDAQLRGDADRLDAPLADDLPSIGVHGYPLGKQEWLDRHRDCRSLSSETTELRAMRHRQGHVPCSHRQ
jgi:hypothetical protein